MHRIDTLHYSVHQNQGQMKTDKAIEVQSIPSPRYNRPICQPNVIEIEPLHAHKAVFTAVLNPYLMPRTCYRPVAPQSPIFSHAIDAILTQDDLNKTTHTRNRRFENKRSLVVKATHCTTLESSYCATQPPHSGITYFIMIAPMQL